MALIDLCRTLQAAQPSMAPVLTALNEALQRCELAPDAAAWRAALAAWGREWPEAAARRAAATLAHARQALIRTAPAGIRVLTHSRSSLVERLLREAGAGMIREVLCCESRPLCEGRDLAAALAGAGLRARLLIDAAAATVVAGVEVVLLGADAVLPGSLVHKIGSRGLALAARQAGVPAYALCPSDRWLPSEAVPLLAFVEHPADEVWAAAPAGVAVENRYFDHTPLFWLRGLVTEQGVLEARGAPPLHTMRLHPGWRLS